MRNCYRSDFQTYKLPETKNFGNPAIERSGPPSSWEKFWSLVTVDQKFQSVETKKWLVTVFMNLQMIEIYGYQHFFDLCVTTSHNVTNPPLIFSCFNTCAASRILVPTAAYQSCFVTFFWLTGKRNPLDNCLRENKRKMMQQLSRSLMSAPASLPLDEPTWTVTGFPDTRSIMWPHRYSSPGLEWLTTSC